MSKYYRYDNASRRLRSGKFTYVFDVVEQFGGNWRGVLKLDNEEEIAALLTFAARFGVVEITEDEYNQLLKKKLNSKPSSPDIIRLPMSRLKETAGVVVVKSPLSPTTPDISNPTGKVGLEISEAVVLGEAPYVDPLATRSKTRRKAIK